MSLLKLGLEVRGLNVREIATEGNAAVLIDAGATWQEFESCLLELRVIPSCQPAIKQFLVLQPRN